MLPSWTNFDEHEIVHLLSPHAIDPGYLGLRYQVGLEGGIVVKVPRDLLQQLHYAVAVLAVAHSHLQSHLGPVPRHVAYDLDGAVGDDMERAVAVAQVGPAHGDFLYGPRYAAGTDCIPHTVLVFHPNKKAGNHVFDQRLRAKSDRQSDDAGAGQ